MAGKVQWVQRMKEAAIRQPEALPGIPLVEIAGDGRVLIECHCGVMEYGTERIRVRVRYGEICVLGTGMELALMRRQSLVITGKISAVQLNRKGR